MVARRLRVAYEHVQERMTQLIEYHACHASPETASSTTTTSSLQHGEEHATNKKFLAFHFS